MPILPVLLFCTALGAFGAPPPQRAEIHYPPERERMAVELRTRTEVLHFVEAAAGIVLLALMVRFGFAQRMRATGAHDFVVVIAVLGVLAIAGWPFSAYRHSLAVHYGLSVQPWGSWTGDWLKATAVSAVVAVPLTLAALAIARHTRWWWLWAWAGAVAVMGAGAFVVPWLVDPLFHHFRPLSQTRPDLVPKLEQVAARAGIAIPPERMFEMEASEKSRAVNAYLTGFGASKRIVLWDTTAELLSPEQIQTVFAHEAGHYALLHVPKSLALASVAMLLLMYGLYNFMGRGAGDASCLPKALLALTVVAFLSEPVVNAYSRWQEHQADIFELEAMHGLVQNPGQNSADVDLIMASMNLEHPRPNPFIVWWLYDHPPSSERIAFALTYNPWAPGCAPKYVN